ncbi:MAG TPA: (5-formylfuran-3-yl)methyl phosphate synthase [Pirellulaceae bacterium]|nr:(5-formylfuran-3-yl)methyl phosphate synthase [Pirellulaceae bacterium]
MSSYRVKLLVSVRNGAEAASALAGGANVIDIKEPDRGALGAADPQVWREVLDTVAGRAPVSAALGELFAADASSASVQDLAAQTAGLAFAKVGLAGATTIGDWPALWKHSLAALPHTVLPVAVAYADWQSAAAPPPEEVIDRGAESGCALVLFDTFTKSGGCLLDHLPPATLARLMHRAAQRSLKVVLAGSLSLSLLPRVLPLSPALIAVRGAACRGNRSSAIDADQVRSLAAALSPDASTIVGAEVPAPLGA